MPHDDSTPSGDGGGGGGAPVDSPDAGPENAPDLPDVAPDFAQDIVDKATSTLNGIGEWVRDIVPGGGGGGGSGNETEAAVQLAEHAVEATSYVLDVAGGVL